ncbi:MAG: PTS mannose/fructose/sorbose/N-acetylgalactosamine transporter subunit IIC [Erysipelotrichaceae bacterium]|jgi:fructoselysine and glucoselysine-specific PTS system IIC component
MSLMLQTLLIFAVAFFAYMHCYFGSTMWNRPIVVSTLVGAVLGDLTTGCKVGAMLELAFLGAVPIGASNPPDMVSGAVIGTAYVVLQNTDIETAVALAIPVAALVAIFDNFLMMFVLPEAAHMCDRLADKADADKIDAVVRVASIGNKVALALIVALGFYFGIPVIEKILAGIPEFVIHAMDVVAGILPAIGVAILARNMMSKELAPWLMFGFLATAYLNVPTFGIALFGIGVAMLYFYKKEEVTEGVDDNEF